MVRETKAIYGVEKKVKIPKSSFRIYVGVVCVSLRVKDSFANIDVLHMAYPNNSMRQGMF